LRRSHGTIANAEGLEVVAMTLVFVVVAARVLADKKPVTRLSPTEWTAFEVDDEVPVFRGIPAALRWCDEALVINPPFPLRLFHLRSTNYLTEELSLQSQGVERLDSLIATNVGDVTVLEVLRKTWGWRARHEDQFPFLGN
jgi:hypothetical protein